MRTNDLAVIGDAPADDARGCNDASTGYLAGHRNDIRPLTGLRGVAALWVVVHHMLLETPLHGPLNNLVHHGYLAHCWRNMRSVNAGKRRVCAELRAD